MWLATRWIAGSANREGGFDGLVPTPRRVANATPERLLELAVALRREQPARTAAQIHRIIVEAAGAAPSARTIQRHLATAGLPRKGSQIARALRRFEAESRNELWTGDALHGPLIDGRRMFLFEAMLSGWGSQQTARYLKAKTIRANEAGVRRFIAHVECWSWEWRVSDVDEYFEDLLVRPQRLARSTLRAYQLRLKGFSEYLCDQRYPWSAICEREFGRSPGAAVRRTQPGRAPG